MDIKLKHEDIDLIAEFVIEDITNGSIDPTESSIKEHIGLLLEDTAGIDGQSPEEIANIIDDIYQLVRQKAPAQCQTFTKS